MPYKNKDGQRNWAREYRRANKTKMKNAMAAYYQRKRRFVADFKNKPCADCQGWFHPVQMDFDHRPGETKLFDISTPGICRIEKIYREMKKCDVVCSNCHRLRTYRRNQHGANIEVLIHRDADRDQLSRSTRTNG